MVLPAGNSSGIQMQPTSFISQLSSKKEENQIELHISCRKLKDLDVFSKSDPVCHFFIWNGTEYVMSGKTEIINNDLNPDFTTFFTLDYSFEKQQKVKFTILDKDVTNSEEIGSIETQVGSIMGAQNQTLTAELRLGSSSAKRGEIIVRAEAVSKSNHSVTFQISATDLANRAAGCAGMCAKTAPVHYEIQREVGGTNSGHFVTSYQSPKVRGTNNPSWQAHKMRLSKFSNGDPNCRVKVALVIGNNKEIGFIITTAKQLLETRQFGVKKGTGQEGRGRIEFKDFNLIEVPTFVDYLRSGWQMSLAVAIDFTSSNGNPTDAHSLHHLGPKNQYSHAISAVGAILEPYDFDNMFPTFGFGGVFGSKTVSHCFPLNGNPMQPTIEGISGILKTYQEQLPHIKLAGPTLFAPVITAFNQYAQALHGRKVYNILLILTDGKIEDMARVKQLIVDSSDLPTSIVIVGVGNSDEFDLMEELDSDNHLLQDNAGRIASRDIVQFVRFGDAVKRGNLAEEVLREIPEQFCLYMEQIGEKPQAQTTGSGPAATGSQ